MTDLEKAKQWLDSKEPSFGGDEVWTITRRNMAEVLAEYASHSNSELLERVQKLEQQLHAIIPDAMWKQYDAAVDKAADSGALKGLKNMEAAIGRKFIEAALAKAPDTRNV